MRRRVQRLVTVLLAAAVLAPAAGAAAAERTVPFGFYGVNWDGEININSSSQTRTSNWKKMADTGVEAGRTTFLWSAAQPQPFEPIKWDRTDTVVKLAVANGIKLLPVVSVAPRWARQSDAQNSPPGDPRWYAQFLQDVIKRYGPDGSFWSENPTLTKRPIRAYQVWNEPSANYQWTIPEGTDWAPGYGDLLRASYTAIKEADPGAKVVLAGLPNHSYQDLRHLYKVGKIHGHFDVAALHPYTAQDHGVLTIADRFHDVMKDYGDGKKQLWITELGLPASKGKSKDPAKLQTDDKGMAKFLTQSYEDLTKNRHRLHVPKVYWYTWASRYKGWIFNYTGLFSYGHKGSEEIQSKKPALAAYRKLARPAQGR